MRKQVRTPVGMAKLLWRGYESVYGETFLGNVRDLVDDLYSMTSTRMSDQDSYATKDAAFCDELAGELEEMLIEAEERLEEEEIEIENTG